MAKRSTVKILDLLTTVNKQILNEPTEEGRKALCFMIERILMDNGHYGGFGYCDKEGRMIGYEISTGIIKREDLIEHLRQYYWRA